jgi:1,2-diacylglycerol 3-beta-galactosyltransferase
MDVVGLPVHPRFSIGLQEKSTARRELNWDSNLPVVMLVAGGDGMGPLYETTRAINDRNLPCQLVVVAGRNDLLKTRLEAAEWNQPTHIYGFVTDMPRKMSAADILVTKAGPATICEACLAGLPMILSGAIPGQETGNVDFVVQNDAGVFAPGPEKVAQAVATWLAEGPERLQRLADNARRLSRPNAVWEIADTVWEYAHRPPIANERRNLLNDLLEVPLMIFPTLS